jgi:hypothetical protein
MSTLTRTLGTSALAAATLAAVVLPATSASAWGWTPPPTPASFLSVGGDSQPTGYASDTLVFLTDDTTPEILFTSSIGGTATVRSGGAELCSTTVEAGSLASCDSSELAALANHPLALDVVSPDGARVSATATVAVTAARPAPRIDSAHAADGRTTVVASATPGEWVLVSVGREQAWVQADASGRAELTVRGGEAGQTAHAKIASGEGTTWGYDWVTFTIA